MKRIIGFAFLFILGVSTSAIAFETRQWIALSESDIAGTCWTKHDSFGVATQMFNSDGTYKSTMYTNAIGSVPATTMIWTGKWRISSDIIELQVGDVTIMSINEYSTSRSDNHTWKEVFEIRNGQLVGERTYVYTLGCN